MFHKLFSKHQFISANLLRTIYYKLTQSLTSTARKSVILSAILISFLLLVVFILSSGAKVVLKSPRTIISQLSCIAVSSLICSLILLKKHIFAWSCAQGECRFTMIKVRDSVLSKISVSRIWASLSMSNCSKMLMFELTRVMTPPFWSYAWGDRKVSIPWVFYEGRV